MDPRKNTFMIRYLLAILFMLMAHPSYALDKIGLPVECRMGRECYIQNYFDHKVGKGYHDFECGNLSYNEHKGTDFRVRDYVDMRQGIDVVAVAPGRVKAIRDNMPDINVENIDPKIIEGRECGNGVIIVHDAEYETQYCHLKKGTVSVKKGDIVEKGQKLGQIGISGMAAFPHVELQIRKNGQAIDPFMTNAEYFGALPELPCNKRKVKEHMWDEAAAEKLLPYKSSALLNAWFTSSEPEAEKAREGRFLEPSIARDSEMIIFWVDIMGLRLRDDLKIAILDPEGNKVVSDHEVVSRNRALYFRYLGKKSKNHFWKPGTYTGRVTLIRDGKVVFTQDRELKVL